MYLRALIVACVATLVLGCSDSTQAPQPHSSPAVAPAVTQTQEAPPPAYDSLRAAITGYKPEMTDTSDDVSPGAVELAMWSTQHMDWQALQDIPATKVSLVMKDSDEERGKRICTSGQIIEIAAEKAGGEKLYEGGLFDPAGSVYRFVAVKSTGDLVATNWATFCGVVIGRQDYANSMGGVAHAVYLVGMFKLPENLGQPAAVAAPVPAIEATEPTPTITTVDKPIVAIAPSFDCAKAKSSAETIICSDPELAQKDHDLSVLYKQAKAVASDKAEFTRQNLAQWKIREETCSDRDCLLAWYANRNAQLTAIISAASSNAPSTSDVTNDASSQILALQVQARSLDNQCRAALTKDPNAFDFCTQRNAAVQQLKALGSCLGSTSGTADQWQWHHC